MRGTPPAVRLGGKGRRLNDLSRDVESYRGPRRRPDARAGMVGENRAVVNPNRPLAGPAGRAVSASESG
jgi:hypothetical protein